MVHLNIQKTHENNGINNVAVKQNNDLRVVKTSEMTAQMIQGSNPLSLYSGQNGLASDIETGAIKFDNKNNLDYMTVMANTMSHEDFSKMMEDGIKPSELDGAESVNTLDRIKAKMAEAGIIIEGYNDDLSVEEIEAVLGNRGQAENLKNEFAQRDLALTNIEDIAEIYKKASDIEEITDGMCDYILRNAVEPTVDNLYRVRYSSAELPIAESGYFTDEYGHIVKDGGSIEGNDYYVNKIKEIINDLDVEDEGEINEYINEGKWLVDSRILLTKNNLVTLHDLRKLNLPMKDEDIAKAIANAVERGKGVEKTDLTKTDNLLERAVKAKEIIDKSTDSDVETLINQNKEINIENLAAVAGSNINNTISTNPEVVRNQRIVAELRLRMTVEANYQLIKRGISLETVALEEAVNALKALEEKVSRDFFGNDEVEANTKAEIWKESRNVVAELPFLPARAVGDIVKSQTAFTLKYTYEAGIAIKEQYEKALTSYETVSTEVRSDLGDDIKKAFGNIESILADEGLEDTELNKKAVRILGYSEIEITKENILDIAQKEAALNRVIQKMNPMATLNLIREGVNPLEISMEELEEKLDNMLNSTENSVDSYARFLSKLDRKGDITESEREAYIGIYRLLDKIEKSDGKALGDLSKAEAGINFKNLLTALRTGKSAGMDIKLDESMGELIRESGYQFDISEQIAKGFAQIVNSNDQDLYIKREFESYKEELTSLDKAAAEELELIGEKVSSENVKAMAEILNNDENYGPWKKVRDYAKAIEGNKFDEAMNKVVDEFNDPESVSKAYDGLLKEASEAISKVSQSVVSEYIDIKSLKGAFKQIGLVSKLTSEENYEIPVEMDGKILNMRVKITHKSEKEGKVFTSFKNEQFGSILGQFGLKNGVVQALVAGDSERGLDNLKSLENLEENFKKAGFEEVTFNYIQTDIINADYFKQHFAGEKSDEVTTKQLFSIAKIFVQTIQKAGR